MRLRGLAIGALIGGAFGGGVPGALVGAVVGAWVENKLAGDSRRRGGRRGHGPVRMPNDPAAQRRVLVFCSAAGAMLAKMAKADGHVTGAEIASVEQAFARMGFSPAARRCAIDAFRRAKDDRRRSIFDYAREFVDTVEDLEVRESFYGLLWDLACADGEISEEEDDILRRMPVALRIHMRWYGLYANEHRAGRSRGGAGDLAQAFEVLGVTPGASDDEVRSAFRERAKRNHPDLLRAQGLPEEMVQKATERMGRINEAWNTIRTARKI